MRRHHGTSHIRAGIDPGTGGWVGATLLGGEVAPGDGVRVIAAVEDQDGAPGTDRESTRYGTHAERIRRRSSVLEHVHSINAHYGLRSGERGRPQRRQDQKPATRYEERSIGA